MSKIKVFVDLVSANNMHKKQCFFSFHCIHIKSPLSHTNTQNYRRSILIQIIFYQLGLDLFMTAGRNKNDMHVVICIYVYSCSIWIKGLSKLSTINIYGNYTQKYPLTLSLISSIVPYCLKLGGESLSLPRLLETNLIYCSILKLSLFWEMKCAPEMSEVFI